MASQRDDLLRAQIGDLNKKLTDLEKKGVHVGDNPDKVEAKHPYIDANLKSTPTPVQSQLVGIPQYQREAFNPELMMPNQNNVLKQMPPFRRISQTAFVWQSYILYSLFLLLCGGGVFFLTHRGEPLGNIIHSIISFPSYVYGRLLNTTSLEEKYIFHGISIIVSAILIALFAFTVIVTIKRLGDMGKNQDWCMLCIIPFVYMIFWFYLAIANTKYDNNNYTENNPFIFEGRMGRAAFSLITIPLSIIFLLTIDVVTGGIRLTQKGIVIFNVSLILLQIIYPLIISCGLKRLRDIGRGKNFMWLLFIPLVNVGLWVYLLTAASTIGGSSNKPFYKAMWDTLDS